MEGDRSMTHLEFANPHGIGQSTAVLANAVESANANRSESSPDFGTPRIVTNPFDSDADLIIELDVDISPGSKETILKSIKNRLGPDVSLR